jgi:hypothetical protein
LRLVLVAAGLAEGQLAEEFVAQLDHSLETTKASGASVLSLRSLLGRHLGKCQELAQHSRQMMHSEALMQVVLERMAF